MMNLLWYITIILSIWGPALGGIRISGLGLLYPFRILSLLLLLFVLIKSDKKKWRFNPRVIYVTILPMILFLILHACISSFNATNFPESLSSILNLIYVFVFVVLFFNFCRDREVLNGTLITLSLNLVVIMAFALLETFFGVFLFTSHATVVYSHTFNDFRLRFPTVCFENTNNLAFNISLTIPFMLYAVDKVLKIKTRYKILLTALLLILSSFVLLQTCSRLGYCAYALAVIIYFSLYIKKPVYLISVFIILIMGTIFVVGGMIFTSFQKTSGYATKVEAEDAKSVRIRGALISQAITVAEKSYLLGVGPGSIDSKMKQDSTRVTSIHQFYVEILAVYGIMPLLFLVYFQIRTFVVALKCIILKTKNCDLAILCLPGTIVMIPASAMLSSPIFFFIMWAQFALWSLLLYRECSKGRIRTPEVIDE